MKYLGVLKVSGNHDFRSTGKQPQSKSPQRVDIMSRPMEERASDVNTKRLLTMHGGLQPKQSVQRLDED